MKIDLKGKNVLVSGGGGFGVGDGICEVLLSCGAHLIINEKDREMSAQASAKFPKAVTVTADVSNASDVEEMFLEIGEHVGVLHALVNNAGVGLNKSAHEASESEFDLLHGVDVKGVWLLSSFFVRQLLRTNNEGNIVNISSVHAHSTIPGYAIYASAKSAVEGLTRGMAVELGKNNIRVNAVAPGYVHAEQNYDLIRGLTDNPEQWVENLIRNEQVIPKKIQPRDCGDVVAFLLSDLSRSITGQTIYADNGNTIKLMGSS